MIKNSTRGPKWAASYIRWWGRGDNCLHADRGDFDEARNVLRAAPVVAQIGGYDIIALLGREAAYRPKPRAGQSAEQADSGYGCCFVDLSVGGLYQPVCTRFLAPGAPSQYVSGLYAGGALCLTEEDAEKLGVLETAPRVRRDAPEVEALFGANVQTV